MDDEYITADQLRMYSRGAEVTNDERFVKLSDYLDAIATIQAKIDYIAMQSNIDLSEVE